MEIYSEIWATKSINQEKKDGGVYYIRNLAKDLVLNVSGYDWLQ